MNTLLIILISSFFLLDSKENHLNKFYLRELSEEIVEAKMGIQAKHILQIEIGTPPQKIRAKLSTAICGLWIIDKNVFGNGFDITLSSTAKELDEQRGKVDFTEGILIEDQFNILGISPKDPIPFLLVDKINKKDYNLNFDGLIGFGYKCRAKSKGNVDLIKILTEGEGKKRNKKILYLKKTDGEKGKMNIGTYPKGLDLTSKKYLTTNLDRKNNNGHWEIKLHSIYLDNYNMIEVNAPLSIGIGGSVFSVSKKVFNELGSQLFGKAIVNEECKVSQNEVWEIFCNNDFDINKIGDISLVIDKWNIKLKPEQICKSIKKDDLPVIWCAIIYHPEYDRFYLSQVLLTGYTVIYDKEKDQIGIFK